MNLDSQELPDRKDLEVFCKELRLAAKKGLDDPALLIDAKHLLDLPIIKRRAKASDLLARARALIEVLTEVLNEFLDAASVRRREVITALFMLDPTWKGTGITFRRQELTKKIHKQSPRSFVRGEEEPLYEELIRVLLDRGHALPVPKPTDDEEKELAHLARSFNRCHASVAMYVGPQPGAVPRHHAARMGLRYFCELYARWCDITRNSEYPPNYFRLMDLFPTPVKFSRFDGNFLLLPGVPWGGYKRAEDLAVLRHQYRLTLKEPELFESFFQKTDEGKALYRTWTKWLKTCKCRGERKDNCEVHHLLSNCEIFLRLWNEAFPDNQIDNYVVVDDNF